jgi:hypothetical protein
MAAVVHVSTVKVLNLQAMDDPSIQLLDVYSVSSPQSWIDNEEGDRGNEQEHPEPNEPEIHPELRGEPAQDEHFAARVRAVFLVDRLRTEPDSSDTD